MAFCHQCGTALDGEVRFCPSCGAASNPTDKPITAEPPAATTWQNERPAGQAADTQSVAGLSTALQWLFGLIAVLFSISAVVAISQRSKIVDIRDGLSNNPFADAQDAENALSGFTMITGLIAIAVFILLIIWSHRSYKNIAAFGVTKYRLGTGMAIGSWFIPFYNLGGPKQIINDVWRASEPGTAISAGWTKRPILPISSIWWISYFVLSAVNFTGLTMVTSDTNEASFVGSKILSDPDAAANGIMLYAAGSLGLAASCVLGLLTIRRITERHELKRTELA